MIFAVTTKQITFNFSSGTPLGGRKMFSLAPLSNAGPMSISVILTLAIIITTAEVAGRELTKSCVCWEL